MPLEGAIFGKHMVRILMGKPLSYGQHRPFLPLSAAAQAQKLSLLRRCIETVSACVSVMSQNTQQPKRSLGAEELEIFLRHANPLPIPL